MDLAIEHRHLHGATVVTARGGLDVATYARFRDTLLKLAAEAPTALIVELEGLEVDRISTLSLFPTVWMRTSVWPVVPLRLAGARGRTAEMLSASAVCRFVGCDPTTAEAVAAVGNPPPRRRAEIELPADVASSRRARVWVAGQLRSFGIVDDGTAALVACELVENALLHTRSGCRLHLEQHPAGLSVAVSDHDPAPPRLSPVPASRRAEFGLALVDALARAWGHSPRLDGGKVVWAVLEMPGGPSGDLPVPASPGDQDAG